MNALMLARAIEILLGDGQDHMTEGYGAEHQRLRQPAAGRRTVAEGKLERAKRMCDLSAQ
ncbi:MAG: hypothetical protein ABJB69_03750 [Spartobacteria bacterium]